MRKSVIGAGLLFAGIIMIAGSHSPVFAESANTQNQTNNIVVEVVKGDSLSKIAKSHQTTYQRLFDANTEITNPDIIYPGQKVRIPDASEQLTSRNQTPAKVVATPKVAPVAKVTPKRAATPKKTAKPVSQHKAIISTVSGGSVWDSLAHCESGGNWSINTGNGFYGGIQFTAATWHAMGGSGLPSQASRDEQIARASALQARSGWGQWPACSAKLGLR